LWQFQAGAVAAVAEMVPVAALALAAAAKSIGPDQRS